jgi:hypothetical protein
MHSYKIVDDKVVIFYQPEYEERTWRDTVCDWIELWYHKSKIRKTEKHKQKLQKQVAKLLPKCQYKDYSEYDLPSVMRKERKC